MANKLSKEERKNEINKMSKKDIDAKIKQIDLKQKLLMMKSIIMSF